MKSILIQLFIVIVLFFFISGTKISFNPFSIKFERLEVAITLLVINTAFVVLSMFSYKRGFYDGAKFTINEMENFISKQIESKEACKPVDSIEIDETKSSD